VGKGRTLKLLGTAQRAAFRRARHDGGPWTTVAIVAFGARTLAKLASRSPEVVHSQVLGPGEQIVISHTQESYGRLGKREAAAAKDAKRSRREAKTASR